MVSVKVSCGQCRTQPCMEKMWNFGISLPENCGCGGKSVQIERQRIIYILMNILTISLRNVSYYPAMLSSFSIFNCYLLFFTKYHFWPLVVKIFCMGYQFSSYSSSDVTSSVDWFKINKYIQTICCIVISHSYILRVVLVIIMEFHWLIGRVL